MTQGIRQRFALAIIASLSVAGCSSGKEVLSEKPERIKLIHRVAVIGFPGQCTHEGRETPFLMMSIGRLGQLKRFSIVTQESTSAAVDQLALPMIRANDEYSTLNMGGVTELCRRLGVDAIVVGFYRTSQKEEATTTPVAQSGNVSVSVSQSYVQTFPTFDVCIVGNDGALLFRAVAEGRKAGFGKLMLDSIVKSESDETFYERVQDALDGVCTMLAERF